MSGETPTNSLPRGGSGFYAVVLDWLRAHPAEQARRAVPAEVVKVEAHGSDWLGDTERGFYDSASVWITYQSTGGAMVTVDITGAALASLWDHVVTAWPENTPR